MTRAYRLRLHIAHDKTRYDPYPGRARTLCGLTPPEAYVLDQPAEGQPMCADCMRRWRRLAPLAAKESTP